MYRQTHVEISLANVMFVFCWYNKGNTSKTFRHVLLNVHDLMSGWLSSCQSRYIHLQKFIWNLRNLLDVFRIRLPRCSRWWVKSLTQCLCVSDINLWLTLHCHNDDVCHHIIVLPYTMLTTCVIVIILVLYLITLAQWNTIGLAVKGLKTLSFTPPGSLSESHYHWHICMIIL